MKIYFLIKILPQKRRILSHLLLQHWLASKGPLANVEALQRLGLRRQWPCWRGYILFLDVSLGMIRYPSCLSLLYTWKQTENEQRAAPRFIVVRSRSQRSKVMSLRSCPKNKEGDYMTFVYGNIVSQLIVFAIFF